MYPYLIQRIKAYFIDWIILVSAIVTFSFILNEIENPPDILPTLLLISLFFFYEPLTISLMGGTIGHHVIGIRVKQIGDENLNIPIFLSFIRFIVKVLLGWISFLTISGSEKKRALHDMACGSVVVTKKIKVSTSPSFLGKE